MSRFQRTSPILPAPPVRKAEVPTWPAVSIVLLVVMPALFPPGFISGMNVYFLGLAAIMWLASGKPFNRDLFYVVAPFLLIIAVGLVVGYDAERWNYWKDAWYVSNPAVVMSVGYVFFRCMPELSKGLRAFVIGGTILALLQLIRLGFHPELLELSANEIRTQTGTGFYAPALALTIIFAYRGKLVEGLKFPRWLGWFCFVLCLTAVIASFSRTMLIVATIGILATLGVFARREWLRIGGVLLVAVLVIFALRSVIDVNSNQASKSFLGKLARSTEELTIEDYRTLKDINLNWRGYEAARAWKYYASGNPMQWLAGYGLGAELDLGIVMPLGGQGGESYRFIPILHNGYSYLLVKGGALAIALFGFVLFRLYRQGRRYATNAFGALGTHPGRLLQGVAVTLAFATWVIGGVFNKSDMFPFLLMAGFLLSVLTRDEKAST